MIQRRHIALLVYAILLILIVFGIEASLPAPGLSLKNALLYVLLIILGLEGIFARRGRTLELQNIHFLFLGLVVFASLSWVTVAIIIDYPGYRLVTAFIELKAQLADKYILLLVFFYLLWRADDARWVLERAVVLIAIAHVLALVDYFNVPDLNFLEPGKTERFTGIAREANQSGALIVLTMPVMIAVTTYSKGLLRALCAFGAAISIVALVVSMSRGAFAGMVMSSLICLVVLRQFVNVGVVAKWFFVAALAMIVGVFLAYVAAPDLFERRIIDSSTSGNLWEASSGRSHIWSSLLSVMLEKPLTFLTGYGWATYLHLNHTGYAPHNSYLYLLFELGSIGVGLFLAILLMIGSRVRSFLFENPSDTDKAMCIGFLFGLYALLVAVFFVELYDVWLLIFAQFGLTLRLTLDSKQLASKKALSTPNKADVVPSGVHVKA